MGVPGLWDILRPAGKQRSLAQLAVYDGFERNPGGRRGLRVGIDASIWFFHATYGREGENPELRTLFFRCARLMSRPFLPLFVFDGPHRPELKRKKKISGKDHWMVSGMQEIIEAFGFEWWFAPGEAEAELAYLNKIGVIDAIITDDVDTFLFGATTIIRNPGNRLSGNTAHPVKKTAGRDDGDHTYVYTSTDIAEYPDVSLSQDGLILIALLRGGDYDPEGIDGCGTGVAHALARCGFGETLLSATRSLTRQHLPAFLDGWRNEVRAELRSNARGFLNSKKLQLAKSFPDTFPNVEVVQLYTHPVTSERKKVPPEFLWNREPDLMKLAALCERKFEWGVREIIVKRFRTVMWAPVVLRIMRRAVLDADAPGPSTPRKKKTSNDKCAPPGTPSKMIARHFSSLSVADEDKTQRLIVGIRGKREHASTDGMPEYRLEIAPAQLVRLTSAGVQGVRLPPSQYRPDSDDDEDFDLDNDEEEGKTSKRDGTAPKKPPPDPDSHLRVWMPACIVERVEPAMVAAYKGKVSQKTREKEEKAARKAARAAAGASPKTKSRSKAQTPGMKVKKAASKRTEHEEEEEEELSAGEDYSHVFNLPSKGKCKGKSKAKAGGITGTKKSIRSRPMHSVREEEEEEEEDLPPPRPSNNSKGKAVPLAEATNGSLGQQLKASASESMTGVNVDTSKVQPSTTLKSSTSLAKQKTILDLLDERSRNSSVHVSSAVSVPSPPKANSQNVHVLAPRPFPLSKTDDNVLFWERDEPYVPRHISVSVRKKDAAKAVVRQYSTIKSEPEDSVRGSPKKSSRKSKMHRSPSSKSIVFDTAETITDSDVDLDDRPASPSPTQPRPSRTMDSASKSARVPSSLSATSGPAKTSVSQEKMKTVEVIEITSGSESEQDNQSGSRSRLTQQGSKSKTIVPTLAKRVSPGQSSQRLDGMFRVVKSNISGSQKAAQAKAGSNKTKSHRIPKYDLNDVIEIL